jgi:iodotyrosine deiodinase
VQKHSVGPDGQRVRHYYPIESVGIATGVLIASLHQAGLAVLTYTPNPMGLLNEVLARPDNERPFLLLVVGHAADGARVPAITKKPLAEISTFL